MKKYGIGLCIILLCCSIFILGFHKKDNREPNLYYQVYLDENLIGTIRSKDSLLKMIDKQGKYIKKKYQVNKVLAPDGLEIKKIHTYDKKLNSALEIYKKIEKEKPFTIPGYQLTLKDGDKVKKVYITDKKIAKTAIEGVVTTFVDENSYRAYLNKTQPKITTTGTEIENIYIQTNMTMKQMNISVKNTIYTDATELSKYLLFGDVTQETTYTVNVGDTIEKVAYANKISPEEFLIYNPQFTSRNNLLFPGQVVRIGMIDPKITVVVESKVVQDVVTNYKTEERFDSEKVVGDDEVVQEGENGLVRLTQKVYNVNGSNIGAETQSTEELKPAINAIIVRGEKVIPNVGYGTWLWPTNSYYVIRGMEYGANPVTGIREAHTGIDITDSCGAPIYAANNGVVYTASYRYDNGYYVTINHNNGYYTLYAHMTRYIVSTGQTVAKGQVIGYVGATGYATGCHLHYEALSGGAPYRGGTFFDARNLY